MGGGTRGRACSARTYHSLLQSNHFGLVAIRLHLKVVARLAFGCEVPSKLVHLGLVFVETLEQVLDNRVFHAVGLDKRAHPSLRLLKDMVGISHDALGLAADIHIVRQEEGVVGGGEGCGVGACREDEDGRLLGTCTQPTQHTTGGFPAGQRDCLRLSGAGLKGKKPLPAYEMANCLTGAGEAVLVWTLDPNSPTMDGGASLFPVLVDVTSTLGLLAPLAKEYQTIRRGDPGRLTRDHGGFRYHGW